MPPAYFCRVAGHLEALGLRSVAGCGLTALRCSESPQSNRVRVTTVTVLGLSLERLLDRVTRVRTVQQEPDRGVYSLDHEAEPITGSA